MCTIVEFPDHNDEADDVDGLRRYCEQIAYDVKFDVFNNPPRGDQCLCGVDVPTTADLNGYGCKRTPFGYELRKAGKNGD